MANKLAVVSIVLWVISAIGGGVMFVRGNATVGSDGRSTILLAPSERDFVLSEMRGMLTAVWKVSEALAEGNTVSAAEAARTAGGKAAAAIPPSLMAKLPMGFKTAGLAMHNGFDEIAAAADGREQPPALAKRLAEQLGTCVGCHQTFRIDPIR